MAKERPPTERQRRFAEAFTGPAMGNATEAARLAGYKGSDNVLAVQGSANLRNPKVAALIQQMNAAVRQAAIADVAECKAILTTIARNEKAEDKDRVSAVDKLLKCQGAYLERHELVGGAAKVTFVFPDDGRGPAPEPSG